MTRRSCTLYKSVMPLVAVLAAGVMAATSLVPARAVAEAPDDACLSATSAIRSVIQLQPHRRCTAVTFRTTDGEAGTATFLDLNPAVGAWYLLTLHTRPSDAGQTYHLERTAPVEGSARRSAAVLEVRADRGSLILVDTGGACELWSDGIDYLREARQTALPYAPLCGGRWYVRNLVHGSYTSLERVTRFLREHVWHGDEIVNFVRETAYRDAFAEHGAVTTAGSVSSPEAPTAGAVRIEDAAVAIEPTHLGIDLGAATRALALGRWYPVPGAPGIFVSLMRPGSLPEALARSDARTVNRLDSIESSALDYLVAMDLQQFEPHFAVGTDEPQVGWSGRVPEERRNAGRAGPDGIDSIAPLVANGMVSPALTARVAVSFAGGFKREHGAFLYGPFAMLNAGSHYGFMQQGVILSSLQPGLATLYVTADGTLGMKTWEAQDDQSLLDRLVDARQNGVPLIELDAQHDRSLPGSLVSQWGAGNWSGSSEKQLRTLRAGACLQVSSTRRRYLIFGYFSTATPSAMALVFQGYGCRYAMQLDINALEHTYFALYTHPRGKVVVQHLIEGMEAVDRKGGGALSPRFLGFPDNRDFFYLLRREARP